MRLFVVLTSIIGLLVLAGCSSTSAPEAAVESDILPEAIVQEISGSELDSQFLTIRGGALMRYVFKPSIKIAMVYDGNFTAAQKEEFKSRARNAILAWLEPLRSLPYGDYITDEVTFVSRSNSHLDLFIDEQDIRAYYRPVYRGSKGEIHLDQFTSQTVFTHEFGHAFGLGDLYREGIWSCREGQYSSSLMCNLTPALTADDIRGARYLYCNQFRSACSPSDYKDIYGGSEGDLKTYECVRGKIISGLYVKTDGDGPVTSIISRCRYVNRTSSTWSYKSQFGGGTGSWEGFLCSTDSYVTGLRIWADDQVNAVQILCSDDEELDVSGSEEGEVYTYTCPSDYPAVKGFRGRSSDVVNAIGLTCAEADSTLY